MTGKRLSALSCNEEEFNKASPQYEEILQKSGYQEKLAYIPPENHNTRRRRRRDILWYNPPFDKQVKTNVGKTFLNLINRHFPPNHRLRAILNRNTVKVSYSCMSNVDTVISSHNREILQEPTNPQDYVIAGTRTHVLSMDNVLHLQPYTNQT